MSQGGWDSETGSQGPCCWLSVGPELGNEGGVPPATHSCPVHSPWALLFACHPEFLAFSNPWGRKPASGFFRLTCSCPRAACFHTSGILETVPNMLAEAHPSFRNCRCSSERTHGSIEDGHLDHFQPLPLPRKHGSLARLSLCSRAPSPSIPTVGLEFLSRRVCAFLISLLQPNAFCRTMSEHIPASAQGLAMKLVRPFKRRFWQNVP